MCVCVCVCTQVCKWQYVCWFVCVVCALISVFLYNLCTYAFMSCMCVFAYFSALACFHSGARARLLSISASVVHGTLLGSWVGFCIAVNTRRSF